MVSRHTANLGVVTHAIEALTQRLGRVPRRHEVANFTGMSKDTVARVLARGRVAGFKVCQSTARRGTAKRQGRYKRRPTRAGQRPRLSESVAVGLQKLARRKPTRVTADALQYIDELVTHYALRNPLSAVARKRGRR